MIINACFYQSAEANIAEHFIQPVDYFDFQTSTRKVHLMALASDYLDDSVSAVLVGGSGIYGRKTWDKLRELVDTAPATLPIVIWGMGINDHDRLDIRYDETLAYLESRPNVLIGLRDCFYKRYVPCVSCMRSEFDARFRIEHAVGLYVHKGHSMVGLSSASRAYPIMKNRLHGNPLTSLWEILRFLGSCDVVITNAYHGAYWATLLGKRVVVVSPFSNKFFGLKHSPIIVQDFRAAEGLVEQAVAYPNALSACREINGAFYDTVRTFIQERRHLPHASGQASALV